MTKAARLPKIPYAVDGVSRLYIYPNNNHNLSVNFNTAMQRTLEFFDKYVKGSS